MRRQGTWHVGTSGWIYPHWRGVFYPQGLPQSQWFSYYARFFDTVEVNNTFYRLPSAQAFDRWREQAPQGFLYSIKANRYITHIRRLRDCAEPLSRFLERAHHLQHTLGPILYQCPPRWRPDPARLEAFVQLLPNDIVQAFEFRDPRWFSPEILEILRTHQKSFCIYHMPGTDCPLEVTAQDIYIRLHGAGALYAGKYDEATLRAWAERIKAWCAEGHDVWVYFNNDAFGHAVDNALTLKELLNK